jgi:amidophosphoribosyltransferase
MREDRVKIKLNPVKQTLKGKSVVVVDDSIVRGTTSARIVRLIRDAGAKEIHMRISAPPFMFPCYYGTDIDSREVLIACNHTIDEICKIIGADTLGYLPENKLGDLIGKPEGCGYCRACFSGIYPTECPKNTQKNKFERKITAAE